MMPTIDMVATGKRIEMLRKAAGISVKDLQDVFGFTTPQAIYKWQSGFFWKNPFPVPSSKWSGHSPFKAVMLGSNPAGII